MHKPVIFNRYLGRKWKEKENHLLANKLTLVKSQVDTKCPVSYVNYKTKLKRENPMTNLCK